MKMYAAKNKYGSVIQFTQRGKYIAEVDIIPAAGETVKVGDKVTIDIIPAAGETVKVGDSQGFNIVCELK